MNKSRRFLGSIVSSVVVLALMGFFVVGAFAASTIGTNMSTTGTLTVTPASDSATSVQFQNTAGTNYFIGNSTRGWVGIGAAPSTVFEVQGTASASYLMTANSLQVAGVASVAYSRFGTGTTGTPGEFDAANDLLITGSLEVDGKASVASNFQTSGRFIADAVSSHSFAGDLQVTKNLVAGGAASSSGGVYIAEFHSSVVATGTFLFAGGRDSASTTGTCFQLKDTIGNWIYMRFNNGATTPTLSTTKCHP